MTGSRSIQVQWLRAIAALMVVGHHAVFLANDLRAPGSPALLSAVPALPSFGAAGVDLFFVISGFAMAHSIAGDRPIGAGAFLLRRAIRILPLFWLANAAFMLAAAPSGTRYSADQLLNSVTLFPLFGGADYTPPPLYVGWTLGFETVFYILVAIVLALDLRHRIAILAALTLMLGGAGLCVGSGPAWRSFLLNPILGEFALGILACAVWRRGIPQRLAAMLTVAGVLLFTSGLVADFGQGFSVHMLAVVNGDASLRRLLVWGLPAAMLLTGLVASPTKDGRLGRWLSAVGAASYMLYLVHPIVMRVLIDMKMLLPTGDPGACAALILVASTGTALILHRFVERPILAAAQAAVERIRAPTTHLGSEAALQLE